MDQRGQIKNLFSESELDSLVQILSKMPVIEAGNNMCHGVNESHIMYNWFKKQCFSRIQDLFGDDCKLVFGMYLVENKPWGIHTDSYHCDSFDDRQPFMSMLIPYSVDFKKELCNQSATIMFQESLHDLNIFDNAKISTWAQTSSASDHYKKYLSHNRQIVVDALTLDKIFQWNLGDLIYWNSYLYHDTDNFIKNGFSSKQAIVLHTYKRIE